MNSRTVNCIMLEKDDPLIIEGIRSKIEDGWNREDIADYYNIYENTTKLTDDGYVSVRGNIPDKLYRI